MFSIALYGLFTAMQGLSVGLFNLSLYRFSAASAPADADPLHRRGVLQWRGADHHQLWPTDGRRPAAALGGFRVAAAIMVCFALLSVVAMLMGRETKGSQLPH